MMENNDEKINSTCSQSSYEDTHTNYRSDKPRQENENSNWRSGRGRGRTQPFKENSFRIGRLMNMDNEISRELFVDNSFVGKILGKRGSKIKELQYQSGAYIKVVKNEINKPDTSIRLSGTSEAVDKAKSLIEDLISGMSSISSRNVSSQTSKSSYSKPTISDNERSDWGLFKRSEENVASLPPILKNFYSEAPDVASMKLEQVRKFRRENNSIAVIRVDPYDNKEIPNPVITFKQAFHNYPELVEELQQKGFTEPSPIQSQAWPILLQGYDMIGIAKTGTCKTMDFLIPILIHITGQVTPKEKRVGPSVVILAPTRELALQIEAEAKEYKYKEINTMCVYDVRNRREQIDVVKTGVDIVIDTPDHLNYLIMNGIINFFEVSYLVLDKTHHMLDMGFEPEIKNILINIRDDRQTVMTSATWTMDIECLATWFMIKPFRVNVGAVDLGAVYSVTQEIIFSEDDYDERRKLLDEFISNMRPDDKAIVFVVKTGIADDISSDLIRMGTNVKSIHGDTDTWDNIIALNDFKAGKVKVLITTDVHSRGIDLKDISLIFNLYFPRNIEEYVHRVDRAGCTGKAISVMTSSDWHHAAELIKILEEADQHVPDELCQMASRYKAWKEKQTDVR